jgi:prolipoprotein diacylglyceryl transferase
MATTMVGLLAGSIPSPESGVLHLGPLPLHAYGLMLALGVVAATIVAERRYAGYGGDPKDVADIAVVVVIAGVVGARLYHLFTGYDWDANGIAGTIQIWEGGLSIWGAVIGGLLAVVVLARRRHLDALVLMDAIAPGLVLAQAIGRWGNYFNQELFGRPTTLPWALEISPEHRPPGYGQYETFHPTFLYESLWCLAVFGLLVWMSRRFPLRKGQVMAAYVALYTFGRIWFEALRIDDASRVFGLRFNLLLSVALCIFGGAWFLWLGRHAAPAARRGTDASDGAGAEVGVPPLD